MRVQRTAVVSWRTILVSKEYLAFALVRVMNFLPTRR